MANCVYTGEAGRYYPDLSLSPEPGKSYDVPACPRDGLWSAAPAPAAPAPAAPVPAPAPAAAPATPEAK